MVCKTVNSLSYEFGGVLSMDYHSPYRFKILKKRSKFQNKQLFVAVFLGCTSTDRVGLCFLWFFVQELPKAQPAVVLVLSVSEDGATAKMNSFLKEA